MSAIDPTDLASAGVKLKRHRSRSIIFIRRKPHHENINALRSCQLDPTCGSGSAVRAAEITRGEVAFPRMAMTEIGMGRIQWRIRMLN